jgi:F-type H+-transporting ATPase subunit delta
MSEATISPAAADQVVADETLEIARRYAEAVIGAAEKDGQVEPILNELAEISRDVFSAFPRFAAILGSHRVPIPEKDRMLVELLQNRASPIALRFLRVLNRHGRLDLMGLVVREAKAIWDRRNKRVTVHVKTAFPLEENQLQALRDRLAQLTGASPTLQVTTDPELIGGLVVQFGDQRLDVSLKSRLEQLRQRLIEGKTHEIQSRRDQFSHSA